MTTPNRFQTYWPQAKEFIKKEWPLIAESAIQRINGDYDLFLKYLRESYPRFPLEEALARDKLQRFFNQLEDVE